MFVPGASSLSWLVRPCERVAKLAPLAVADFAPYEGKIRDGDEHRRLRRTPSRSPPQRMFTARATTSAIVTSEISDCRLITSFASTESGCVSVGLSAVALVSET